MSKLSEQTLVTPADTDLIDLSKDIGNGNFVSRGSTIRALADALGVPRSTAQTEQLQIIACVVRRTGGAWVILDDSSHTPIPSSGMTMTDAGPTGTTFTLNYGFTAQKVHSLVAVPDEQYASPPASALHGPVSIGASVGLSVANFSCAAYSGCIQSYLISCTDGATPTFSINPLSAETAEGFVSGIGVTYSAGNFNITHPASIGGMVWGTCMNPGAHLVLSRDNGYALDNFDVGVYDLASGALKTSWSTGERFQVHRRMLQFPKRKTLNNNDLEISGANFWILGLLQK